LPGITNPDKEARQADVERTHERDTEFEENLLTQYFGVLLEKDRVPLATDQFLAVGTDPRDVAPAEASPIATVEPPRWREPVLRAMAGTIRAFADLSRIRDPLEAALPKERGWHAGELIAVVAGTIGLRMLAFLAAALVGVAIGLTISAMVRTGTQAVMWVPLVLIPQILLGGFVITRAEMSDSVRRLSALVPSFAAQRIMDVSNVYSLTRPDMTNRTRIPLFVSGGDKDTVVWVERGKTYTAQYDRVSEQNVSWQNLLVISSRVGQHRLQYRPKTSPKVLKETVDYRYDVVDFPEGTAYPVSRSGLDLAHGIVRLGGDWLWRDPLGSLGKGEKQVTEQGSGRNDE